ncbi:MAG TPA: AbrB family transcriptional regulator [Hyphomicrobiaceae bacterium]|nr:AbrB family transcriptional regulator [Hyphomicrobiaceae bacterium]
MPEGARRDDSRPASSGGASTTAFTWARDPVFWVAMLATYGAAVAAGFTASLLRIPLPWMLGPFFFCSALSLAGVKLRVMPGGRELGQIAIGLAVGMRFTPQILAATFALLPAMVAATLYIMLVTTAASFLYRWLARVDATTAFFATAAGGVADMAIVAQERGGLLSAVAITHALRVSTTVAIIPILVVSLGAAGSSTVATSTASEHPVLVVLALALATAFAWLLKASPLPNPWMVGPIILGIVLGVSGLFSVHVPNIVIVLAQLALGTWLGCQFKREIILSLPRIALSGLAASLFMLAAAGAGAALLSAATGLPVTTSFLSLAPAAITEMVITAQVMHLDAEFVTAFHVMRIAIVSSTILFVYALYNRLVGMIDGPRI